MGFFNDDAIYILAARSILSGNFCQLASPTHPPINQYLPVYPLFLAPFVYVLAPHWAWLKGISIGVTLGAGILLSVLWKRTSQTFLVMTLGLFYMNPIIAMYSGSVMSDVFFALSTLLAYLTMRWMMGRPSEWRAWILGIVLAGICLIRPIGVLVPISIVLSLVCSRRARLALHCSIAAIIMPGAFYMTRYYLTHRANSYLGQWGDSLPFIVDNPRLWLHHVTNVFHTILNEGLLGSTYSLTTPLAQCLAAISILACLLIILSGCRRTLELKLLPKEVLVAMGLWGGLYFVVHSCWSALDHRYAIPMITLILPIFVLGVESLCQKVAFSKHALLGAIAILLTNYAFLHVRLIQETRSANRPVESLLPEDTYRWINTFVPSGAIFLSRPESTYLYTERCSFEEIKAGDLEEFRYALMKLRISHIFSQPISAFEVYTGGLSRDWIRNRYRLWALAWPEAFPLIYRNDKENTLVFHVAPQPLFHKSYQLYLAAEEALKQGQEKMALEDLHEALRAYPTLVHALNSLGSLMAAEGRLDKAEQAFQKALRVRPSHPLTNLNLAVVYRRKGLRHQSQIYLKQCVHSLQGSPELKNFLPRIEKEQALLAAGTTME